MSSTHLLLPSAAFSPHRYRPGNVGNWSGHLPFARDLIANLRPVLLVELGTHYGESYFGFCQAIAENSVPCLCYAIDTWKGESHTGYYGEEVYDEVRAYNQANYSNLSYLIRCRFDEALGQFQDNSIELLHIDGLHTYEAVCHDFYAWLPKVKPGGIVAIHDTSAKHEDFGVWKLWEELRDQGLTFEFHHSWGLGVFEKRGASDSRCDFLNTSLCGSKDVQDHLRRYYFLSAIELERKRRAPSSADGDCVNLQLYLPSNIGYSEDRSEIRQVRIGEWQRALIDLPDGLSNGALRLDPADRPAIIDIRGVKVLSAFNDKALATLERAELSSLGVGGTLMLSPNGDTGDSCRFFSYGGDPQLYLPNLNDKALDQPLKVEIWLRVQPDFELLVEPLKQSATVEPSIGNSLSRVEWPAGNPGSSEVAELERFKAEWNAIRSDLERERDEARRERDNVRQERDDVRQERDDVRQERDHIRKERDDIRKERDEIQRGADEVRRDAEELRRERDEIQREADEMRKEAENFKAQVLALQGDLACEHQRLEREEHEEAELQTLIETLRNERDGLTYEINKKQTQVYLLKDCHELLKGKEQAFDDLEHRHSELQKSYDELQDNNRRLLEEYRGLQTTFDNVLSSHSWKLTSPLRGVVRLFRHN